MIVAARIGATGAITSERNASISGDAYRRMKKLFMVNLRSDGLEARFSRGFPERDTSTAAEPRNGSAASFHSTCVRRTAEQANLDIRGQASSISPATAKKLHGGREARFVDRYPMGARAYALTR